MKRIFLTIIVAIAGLQARAHEPADGKIHAAFGPYIFQTHSFSHYFKSPIKASFGVVVEADLDKHGGVELSIFHMNQVFSIEKEDKVVIEEGERLYIGMGYRHWFNKNFAIAPSFFSSYVMGDAKLLRNEFGTPNPPKTSARDTVEYGFDLSVQYETWQQDGFALIFDARYAYSVTPKPDEDSNHYGVMVAFKYLLQVSEPLEEEAP